MSENIHQHTDKPTPLLLLERGGKKERTPTGQPFLDFPDIVCFSHLRWNFVYQRPQHLMSRFARDHRVFFVEEPLFEDDSLEQLLSYRTEEGVTVLTPRLRPGLSREAITERISVFLQIYFVQHLSRQAAFWYYTPMALEFTRHYRPSLVIYDCMDELSNFKGAPAALRELELELFQMADVVFTGGYSLYEEKKPLHHNIYPMPSSIDKDHFFKARHALPDPVDQQFLPSPRLGFYGVIDERLDLELLAAIAELRRAWHFVIVGPVIKIDPASLPRRDNIHYLGGKSYQELPAYLANWDIAIMPFARNKSTKFISPTKTPEFLAGGRPVVSTPLSDVVRPYEEEGLITTASDPHEFVAACERAMHQRGDTLWKARVDRFLDDVSWERTWSYMHYLMEVARKRHRPLSDAAG